MFNVGVDLVLANGEGVSADGIAARFWFIKAAALGHQEAQRAAIGMG
jgi:TPR repeat protein